MNIRPLIAALALCVAVPTFAADTHTHGPKHGGVHVAVKDIDFELVAKPSLIQLHVSDHDKPIDYAKATAKLTLLVGTQKRDVELKAAGDKFEAKGAFELPPGTKAVAQVSINGKTSTARFALK